MIPTRRPRSAPETSENARIASDSRGRGTNLSTDWSPRQGNSSVRYNYSSSASSPNERRTPEGSLVDADPWARKNLLCLDGGGIRGYSTLLILRALMTKIAELEQQDDPRSTTSTYPCDPRPRRPVRVCPTRVYTVGMNGDPGNVHPSPPSLCANYLPAHYFDYLAGTSTGG